MYNTMFVCSPILCPNMTNSSQLVWGLTYTKRTCRARERKKKLAKVICHSSKRNRSSTKKFSHTLSTGDLFSPKEKRKSHKPSYRISFTPNGEVKPKLTDIIHKDTGVCAAGRLRAQEGCRYDKRRHAPNWTLQMLSKR